MSPTVELAKLSMHAEWSKIKKKYINFCDHVVAGTSSPVITEMDGKPISGRG